MDKETMRSGWMRDEATLAEIGEELARQPTVVSVRIPRELADAAVTAWQREENDDNFDLGLETCEQRIIRHRAGALALIGAAIEGCGSTDGDVVAVGLDAWFIGDALNAADDRGLIGPPNASKAD